MRKSTPKTRHSTDTAVAVTADLPFIIALSNSERNAMGFFPTAAIKWYVENLLCTIALLNGERAGFCFGRHSMRYARWCRPITALAVAPAARQQHVATRLLTAVGITAVAAGQEALQAWTRNDLRTAVTMWTRFGFTPICERLPDTADAKPLTLWRYSFSDTRPSEFFDLPPVAGWKAAKITAVTPTPRR